jgi:hypothetical protein
VGEEEAQERELLEAELRARVANARTPLEEAVWRLALGEPAEGLEAIRRRLTDAPEDERHGVLWTQLAVLAGDWDTAAEGARSAVPDLEYVTGYREYAAAILCLVAGDEEEARANVERLEDIVAGREKLRSGHPAAVSEIPRGLLDRDGDRVAAGLEALLAWHVRRARARSHIFNSAHGVVCLDAIVALLLAHRRGLAVPVGARHRAARLPLLAVYLTEWDGKPLPRAIQLSLDADVVAGSWLRTHGVDLEDAPPAPAATATRRRKARGRGEPDVGEDFARRSLRLKEQAGEGSAWQLTSWALMLGDVERAREHLQRGAAAARRLWRETAPEQGRGLRWLWQSQALPNHNRVREHFALALALGDDGGVEEARELLAAWAQAVEDDRLRRGQAPYAEGRYGHADGYLDLIGALLGGEPLLRADAELVTGPLASTRVACVALVERDPELLTTGLDGMLAEHADGLERRSSPPPSLCTAAVDVAVAARRLGLRVDVDERYARYLVPVEIRNLPGLEGRFGRLPCDLLARPLWDT